MFPSVKIFVLCLVFTIAHCNDKLHCREGDTSYIIMTKAEGENKNRVLDSNNFGKVYTHDLNGMKWQRWVATKTSGGFYTLKNVGSGLLLEGSGVGVFSAKSNGQSSQQWHQMMAPGGFYIENKEYKQVLVPDGDSLVLRNRVNSVDQMWTSSDVPC